MSKINSFHVRIYNRALHEVEKIQNKIKLLPQKFLSKLIVRIIFLLLKNYKFKKNKSDKHHFLILRNQKYANGSSQLSTEVHHLDNTLLASNLATFEILTYDEDLFLSPLADIQLIRKCIISKPTAIIFSSWWTTCATHPSVETIQLIRMLMDIPVLGIWWDTCSKQFSKLFLNLGDKFDLHLIMDNPQLLFFKNDAPYFDRLIPLWTPQNANLFYTQSTHRNINLSFVGQISSYRSYRSDVINFLKESKVNGYFSAFDRNKQISHEDYSKTFRNSKMSINFSQSVDSDQLKGRIFEIIFSGALLLESENNQISQFFEPMIDYVPFSSKEDLLSKILYYEKHEAEREKIALHGTQTALTKYNSNQFWKTILNRIGSLNRS